MPEEEIFDLSDIEISTVGLVRRGAVSASEDDPGRNFLLIKAEEATMPEELNIEGVVDDNQAAPVLPETPPEGWAQAIKGWMKEILPSREADAEVEKEDPKALAQAVKTLKQGGYEVSVPKLAQMLGDTEEEEEEEEPQAKRKKTRKDDGPVVNTTEIVKAEVQLLKDEYVGVIDELRKSADTLKQENATLREDLDGLRQDRDVEKTALRRQQAIRKAEELRMMPVPSTDLAELLMKAEDGMEKKDFEKLEALLKATDAQLFVSGVYGEIGTSRSPEQVTIEDKVKKAAQGDISYEEALQGLPEAEKLQLVRSWDEQSRGGK